MRDATVLGRRLRFVDYGHGPGLLLVHGLGGCWQWWLENIPALGEKHRVIAVDLPGFGASEQLPPPATMAMHAATLRALLDHAGLERAILAAHSMGGLVALRFAADRATADRLDGLILVCAGGILLDPARLTLLGIGFRAFYALFAAPGVPRAFALRPRLRHLLFSRAVVDRRTLDPRMAAQLVPNLAAPGFPGAVRAGIQSANDTDPQDVRTPTLLVWGDRDPILPVAGARQLAERMPDAHLHVMEGVGHCPMFERDAAFNALVAGFASTRPKSTTVHAP